MKKLKTGVIACLFLLVFGCTKHVEIDNACAKQLADCRLLCEDNCQNCINKSINSAVKSYNRYVQEQKTQGGMVIQQLKSYRDPLQCRKISCSCMADYNVCLQGRSGIIHKRLQVNTACER